MPSPFARSEYYKKRWKEPEYRQRNRELRYKSLVKYRTLVFDTLGRKCNECSFSDVRALQIDHVNGDGFKEKVEGKRRATNYFKIYNSLLNSENRFQVLCANCNWIKRHENNEQSKRPYKLVDNSKN